MNDEKKTREPWLRRFSARGGLNISLTLIAAPFLCHFIRESWHLDWFYTILVGSILSVLVAHIFLLPIAILSLRFLMPASFCELCPACGERALAVGMRISERTADPGLHRVYQLADCRRCHRHFHRLDDGTYTEQTGNA